MMIVVIGINQKSGELVAGPDIVTRGFIYARESEQLIETSKVKVKEA